MYGSDPEASGSLFSTGAGTTARVDETDLVARDAERHRAGSRARARLGERRDSGYRRGDEHASATRHADAKARCAMREWTRPPK